MTLNDSERLIEAILYIENEPLSCERIAKLTGLENTVVHKALDNIAEYYFTSHHGLSLVENEGIWHFIPSSDLNESLRACYGQHADKRLSKAAVETLAIVAYSQPVTRSEITKIRGVSSDNIVRILRERDYIKIVGRKNVQGHPCLYGTTRKFLFTFNLESISDLPRLSEADKQRYEKDAD